MLAQLLNRLNVWFEGLPDRLRPRRRWIWIWFVILTLAVSGGGYWVKFDMTLDAYFQDDDPMKQNLDRFRMIFGSDESSYVIYRAKDGDIFSDASLRAVRGIQEDLQQYRLKLSSGESHPLDHIADVQTLLNASYMEATEDALISRKFIGDRLPETDAEREGLRKAALEHPDYPLLYLSEDSQYGGLMIRTDFGTTLKHEAEEASGIEAVAADSTEEDYGFDSEEDTLLDLSGDEIEVAHVGRTEGLPEFQATEMEDYVTFSEALYEILNKPEYTEHLEYHPVGMAEIMHFMMEMMMTELGLVSGGSILLILLTLALLFRSFSGMVWPTLLVILTSLWVVGAVGWTGMEMSSMITILVYLILAVGVADSVHVLSGYLFFRNQGESHEQALRSTFRTSGLACLLTSITTGIGLTALLFVPIVPIQTFGLFAAIGVLLAFCFTIFLLPLMLDLWSPFHRSYFQEVLKSLQEVLKSLDTFVKSLDALLKRRLGVFWFSLRVIFKIFGILWFSLRVIFKIFGILWYPFRILWYPFRILFRRRENKPHIVQRVLRYVEPLSHRYPWTVTLVFSAMGAVLLVGAFRVHVDSNFVNIIKEGASLRTTYELVDRVMSGTNNMQILINANQPEALRDPEMLKAMDDLQRHLEETYPHLVTRSHSLVDITKDSFRTLNEGRQEMYRIPEDPAVLGNTLFMFNNANPKDRRRVVTDDYAMGQISVSLRNAGSHEYSVLIREVETWATQRFQPLKTHYPELEIGATGTLALMMMLTDYISWSQIKSFGLALVVISVLLLLVFGSFRAGLVALFPNLFPILTIFGLMGWFGIPLDADTLLVAPITIGIAVDDTIHFLTHYRTEFVQHGDARRAVIQSFRETGQAITFTSIILSLGFLIFLFSSHNGLSNFGVMSAVAFFTAVLADLFLLPSLCLLTGLRFGKEAPTVASQETEIPATTP